jgi:hypothetical protein
LIGLATLGAGILLAVLGGSNGYAADAGPAVVRLGIGVALALVGLGFALSALVIAGVGWYLKPPNSTANESPSDPYSGP